MRPPVPDRLRLQISRLDEMSRWERSQLGRELRRIGWTYREIGEVVPAAKSTIAGWCRDIALSPEQESAIRERTGSRRGIPRDTQWRRHEEIKEIERLARERLPELVPNPLWCVGTALYWGEGSKSKRALSITNSDPSVHRVFHRWVRSFLIEEPSIVLHLHLHRGNDERAAKEWWRAALDLPDASFDKTFVKPAGTSHRKNHLAHGIARSRVRRSTDAWITAMEWISCIRIDEATNGCGILLPGR